mmetsp:Transcript_845/g.1655  ORF Transcript_845/g.1655 Transcript_845/m.1655 type:complete len:161 (-) Transcript_845:35-517(-)
MKSLVGSTNFLVPLRPAVRILSLLISVREVALEERVRDFLEDTFICRLDDEENGDDDGDVRWTEKSSASSSTYNSLFSKVEAVKEELSLEDNFLHDGGATCILLNGDMLVEEKARASAAGRRRGDRANIMAVVARAMAMDRMTQLINIWCIKSRLGCDKK